MNSINFVCETSPFHSNLLSIVSSFDLIQVVTEPTRVSLYTATLIDLVFVSCPPLVESCITIPPLANSDHNGLQLVIRLKSANSGMLRPGACVYKSTWKSLKITEAWPMAAS